MANIAILDDYQGISQNMASWGRLPEPTQISVFQDHLFDEHKIAERLQPFHIISAMRERTPFSRTLLEKLDNLQLLVTTGMRNASIDLEACSDLGIVVCGTDGLGYPTAELTWGLIISLARNIHQENTYTRSGLWQQKIGVGLNGKVLGILGLGKLGSQVAKIGVSFGMEVIAWSKNLTKQKAATEGATLVPFKTLLENSDFLSIHTVLSERTRGLIGEKELRLMKPTAFLVNTSRGPIIDENALVSVLQEKGIAGAGLDVFDREPLSKEHPLLTLHNALITPHIGYVTTEGYKLFFKQTVECINEFLKGTPVRILND